MQFHSQMHLVLIKLLQVYAVQSFREVYFMSPIKKKKYDAFIIKYVINYSPTKKISDLSRHQLKTELSTYTISYLMIGKIFHRLVSSCTHFRLFVLYL